MSTNFPSSFAEKIREKKIATFAAVFILVLGSLKLNQYLFFHLNTNPAVILLPTGIALAAIYLGGYRMWIPLFCAWLIGSLTSPSQPTILIVVIAAVAYTLQAVIGAYALVRLKFLGTLENTSSAVILIAVAFFLPVIAASITTISQLLIGSLTTMFVVAWGRAWAGGVVNILVVTPFITTWVNKHPKQTSKELTESIIALFSLALLVYLAWWIPISTTATYIALYALIAVLFWIGMRLRPHLVTLALFMIAVLGMTDDIVIHTNATTLDQRLIGHELLIILIAPIFFILAALIQERRISVQQAEIRAEELEEANRKLASADRAKSDFLAMLSHELRNPLAPIKNSLELLKMENSAGNAREEIEIIEHQFDQMTKLLGDLMDINRLTHGKFILKKQPVELSAIVRNAKKTTETMAQTKNITLSLTLPPHASWTIADPVRIEQALTNLLHNAEKFTPQDGHISIRLDQNGRTAVIEIADDGIGIHRDDLERIFDLYVQGNDKVRSYRSGIGIGLQLVREIVRLHDGSVEVKSDGLGKGSTFTIRLPLAEADEPAENKPLEQPPGLPPRKKILIVDDRVTAANALAKLLRVMGYETQAAYSSKDSLPFFENFNPDLAIIDLGMPDIDGYGLAENLRNEYHIKIPLVALSGYGMEEDKKRASEAGFDHHLTKPVGMEQLRELFAKYW